MTTEGTGPVEKINLGCGRLILPAEDGWVNVDVADGPGVDVVHDLDRHPWPFPSGGYGEAVALDIYEHVDDPLGFMAELWRVLAHGSQVRLRTTRWNSEQSFRDPTHKRFLTKGSFDYWHPGSDVHARYGLEYSGGRHFRVDQVWEDGEELEWRLTRLGSCEGACTG